MGSTRKIMAVEMNGDESRKLKTGDRVCWRGDAKNQGVVKGVSWSGVTIECDDGEKTSVNHNDMTAITLTEKA